MLSYTLRRLAGFLPLMVAVVLIVFLASRAMPGDPVATMLSDHSADKVMAADPQGQGDVYQVLGVQRPAEIVNYKTMGSTPAILGAGLAVGGEAGPEFFHRVVQRQFALLDQHHGRDPGEVLGHRHDLKEGVFAHRLVVFDIGETDGVVDGNLAMAGDQVDGAGDDLLVDQFLQAGLYQLQLLGVHAR